MDSFFLFIGLLLPIGESTAGQPMSEINLTTSGGSAIISWVPIPLLLSVGDGDSPELQLFPDVTLEVSSDLLAWSPTEISLKGGLGLDLGPDSFMLPRHPRRQYFCLSGRFSFEGFLFQIRRWWVLIYPGFCCPECISQIPISGPEFFPIPI